MISVVHSKRLYSSYILGILDLSQFSRDTAMNKVNIVPALTELTSCGGMKNYRHGDIEIYNMLGMINTLNKKSRVREQRVGGQKQMCPKEKAKMWKRDNNQRHNRRIFCLPCSNFFFFLLLSNYCTAIIKKSSINIQAKETDYKRGKYQSASYILFSIPYVRRQWRNSIYRILRKKYIVFNNFIKNQDVYLWQ